MDRDGYAKNYLELKNSAALIEQGQHLEDAGKLDEAEQCYRRAAELATNPARSHLNIGNVLSARGALAEAKAQYNLVLKYEPTDGGAYANLGRVDLLEEKFTEAVRHFKNAAELLSGVGWAEATISMGFALSRLGELEQAKDAYHGALAIIPDHPWANLDLGFLLMRDGQLDVAVDHLYKAIDVMPGNADAHNWVGEALSAQGLNFDASKHMAEAQRLLPDDVRSAGAAVFTLNYLPDCTPERLYDAHLSFAKRFCAPFYPKTSYYTNSPLPDRPLRIGYVSSDFQEHPISVFVEPLFTHHSRDNCQIYCFYNHSKEDAITRRLRSLVDDWHGIVGLNDEEVDQLIRGLEIDILIDLNGLTKGHRVQLFARKPAPIQMTWLGYLGTTGLATMGYRICDNFTDPPGLTERYHTEKLVRVPDCQWCYSPSEQLPPVSMLPFLRNGYITLGSFNNVAKLNDDVLLLWAQVLNRISGARMCFAAIPEGRAQDRIVALFGRSGVPAQRIEFIPRLSYQKYLAAIGDVDIALDPFPYNGGTTSMDTLIMGVPLVVLAGDRSIARGGCSILSNIGLPELIAANPSEIIAKVLELVGSPKRLGELRRGLRERMLSSPLMDGPGFAHGLERIYRECWREWCSEGRGHA